MMERDRRLTGSLRGQSVGRKRKRRFRCITCDAARISQADLLTPLFGLQTQPIAPAGFAQNSVWGTEKI